MLNKLHKHYKKGDLTLRDYLAAHRTLLANERTWLSCIRTSLTFIIAGITFIKFFDSAFISYVGLIFLPMGLFCLLAGLWKYYKVRILIKNINYGKKDITKI